MLRRHPHINSGSSACLTEASGQSIEGDRFLQPEADQPWSGCDNAAAMRTRSCCLADPQAADASNANRYPKSADILAVERRLMPHFMDGRFDESVKEIGAVVELRERARSNRRRGRRVRGFCRDRSYSACRLHPDRAVSIDEDSPGRSARSSNRSHHRQRLSSRPGHLWRRPQRAVVVLAMLRMMLIEPIIDGVRRRGRRGDEPGAAARGSPPRPPSFAARSDSTAAAGSASSSGW